MFEKSSLKKIFIYKLPKFVQVENLKDLPTIENLVT